MAKDDFLHELIQGFELEAKELVEGASGAIMELENPELAPEQKAEKLNRLGRHLHTLKGSAATCGLLDCAELAHKLEDLIAPFKADSQALEAHVADLVLKGLDIFISRVSSHAREQGPSLANVRTAFPELWNEASVPQAAVSLAAPAEAGPVQEAPLEEASSSWRVDQKQVLQLLREVERLRELRLGLMDRGRELDLSLAEIDRGGYGSEARRLKLNLQRLRLELSHDIENAGAVVDLMEEYLKAIYTVPVAKAMEGLHRAVRDACRSTGKQAKLSIAGAELQLDKRMLEALYGPLLHLLRNAVDHGLESPDIRDSVGKHREGALVLRFEQQGNWLSLEVGDDGKGLDAARLKEVAVKKGLLDASKAATLGEKEAWELIFMPGFSTQDAVSSLSGRGVGMDVVRQAVRNLKGMIEIQSSPGSGTHFLITLPLSLGASPTLLIRAGQSLLGLPTQSVETVFKAESSQLERVGEEWRLRWQEQWLRLTDLSAALGLRTAAKPEPGANVVILQSQGRKLALLVEGLEGDAELVIAPLPDGVCSTQIYQGAALHAGAEMMLVLRPDWLIEQSGIRGAARGGSRALVIDDSLAARAMHRGILESGGYVVHAVAMASEGVQLLEAGSYDVIVCDISMEGMDGFQFCAAVKQGQTPLVTPVVLVSANDDDASRAAAVACGAEAFISKKDCASGRLLEEVARARNNVASRH